MSDTESHEDVRQVRTWVIMILVALLSGGGSNYLMNTVGPVKTFTESDGINMEQRLLSRFNTVEGDYDKMLNLLLTIIAQDAAMDAKISNLESRCNKIEAIVDRIREENEKNGRK
jgi:hypothetical protein